MIPLLLEDLNIILSNYHVTQSPESNALSTLNPINGISLMETPLNLAIPTKATSNIYSSQIQNRIHHL